MPRPTPVPVRLAVLRLWEQKQVPGQIAATLGLPCTTVRRLIRWLSLLLRQILATLFPEILINPDRI